MRYLNSLSSDLIMNKILTVLVSTFLFIAFDGQTQDVSYSKELNIRSDFYYDLMGIVDDHIVMHRDRGTHHEIEVFERDLNFKWSKQLKLEKRRVNIIGTLPRDTSLLVFYQYQEDDNTYLVGDNFDISAKLLSTDTIMVDKKGSFPRLPELYVSDSESYGVFFSRSNKQEDAFAMTLVNLDSMSIVWDEIVTVKALNIQKHFKQLILTDRGDVIFLFEKDNKKRKKEKHLFDLVLLPNNSNSILRYSIDMSEVLSSALHIGYDNVNNHILITGLYNDKNTQDALGYYYLSADLDELKEEQKPILVPFTDRFIADVYGTKKGKQKVLENFMIKDAIYRQDGGFLIVAEMHKEYSRRTNYGTPTAFGGGIGYPRGWTDYYDEEIILININPNGEELWKEVLYKKQFSQDDDGIYSSFFLSKTPSRMRILFNDEIKRNSTASEYVISPTGAFERNSILSTENQRLKLRFKDGMQLSANEVLVPSESNGKLRLVKISY